MAWISAMWNYARARARVKQFKHTPPGSDIVLVTEALVFAAEDGDSDHVSFMNDVIDAFEWNPIKPKALARNEDYGPDMAIASACVALMRGDKKAESYLQELVETFGSARRAELKAVGAMAQAVLCGEWPGKSDWNEYPVNHEELHEGLLGSSFEAALEVAHTPHGSLFGETIFYLLPLCLSGQLGATRDAMVTSLRARLGPGPSRRGELLYRRSVDLPRRADVLERHVPVGIVAIDIGDRLHVYHDGFSWHEARWKFDPDGDLAKAILELGDTDWRDIENAVAPRVWKKIDATREEALHILAVNPVFVRVSDEARERAEQRFQVTIEVVPFLET